MSLFPWDGGTTIQPCKYIGCQVRIIAQPYVEYHNYMYTVQYVKISRTWIGYCVRTLNRSIAHLSTTTARFYMAWRLNCHSTKVKH